MDDFDKKEAVKEGFLGEIKSAVASEMERRKKNPTLFFADLSALLVAFLFAGCHVVFGARPLAIGLIALLPTKIWPALIGAVLGSLTLGTSGPVYAIICVLLVALRIIISGGGGNSGERALFSEGLLIRMCEATIGGFAAGAYEVIAAGITLTTVLFGISMVLLSPLVTFALSGIFDTGISFYDFLFGKRNLLGLAGREEKEKYAIIFFECSALLLSFFISLSLKGVEILGFSFSYIFVGGATIFISKRFGALRSAAVGFVSALPLSAPYSVAFALSGLLSGALFSFGTVWAIGAGAVALSLWSAYSGGFVGVLSTLPEYAIAAAIVLPFSSKATQEKRETEERLVADSAGEMVGTMALAYKNRSSASLDALECALSGISSAARRFGERKEPVRYEEYLDLVIKCTDEKCRSCDGCNKTAEGESLPYRALADRIAESLLRKEPPEKAESGSLADYCIYYKEVFSEIYKRAAELEEVKYKQHLSSGEYEDYILISKLISSARRKDERECTVDAELSSSLEPVFAKCGLKDGVIRVLGDRKKHIIAAGEDADGSIITSPEIKRGIEEQTALKLGNTEYFRRGKMVLMETGAVRKFGVECATASIAGSRTEVSGDLASSFETGDDYFYSLISDGMGSGDIAKETAEFVSSFLEEALGAGAFSDTVLHILNHMIRRRGDECAATVDLFEFDLIGGDAVFIKSGAAPSYVKRDSSIFRIRSETAPIGVMKSIDAERVRVEVGDGDYVIMLSDGVSTSPEDAPWLLDLLSKPPKNSVKEYAEHILSAAVKNSSSQDDMTVAVVKIKKSA